MNIAVKKLDKQYKKLTEDELKCMDFLAEYHPDYILAYAEEIAQSRLNILNRLVAGMLREDVMGLFTNSFLIQKNGLDITTAIPLIDSYRNLLKKVDASLLNENITYRVYPLPKEKIVIIPLSQIYAFRRMEIIGKILCVGKTESHFVESVSQFLDILQYSHLSHLQFSWKSLEDELNNGSANLALAYAFSNRAKEVIREEALKNGAANTIEYVLLQKQKDPVFSSSLFFEQLCIEGHNLHPGAKTKMEMEPGDVAAYAPEFKGQVKIRFAAVHREWMDWNEDGTSEPNRLLFDTYPGLKRAAARELATKNLMIEEYVVVPLHPWQLKNSIPKIYAEELRKELIVPIDSYFIESGATSSFRTLVPQRGENGENNLAFKVAVNSQMTSTVRSISANTTKNAVKFTNLIREVMEHEPGLRETFVPVYELAGYNFKTDLRENELKSRNLSAVLREDVEKYVGSGETAVVGSSLYASSPVTDKPIVVELIELYAKERKENSLNRASLKFLADYANIALSGFITMMVKYGIGLEGHLQNSIPVFKNGVPVRMLFRDWGGARIYQDRLRRPGIKEEFSPGSVTLTDSLKEMQNKVFYTVFQNHLGELVFQISKYFGVNENLYWKEIRNICDRIFMELAEKPEWKENSEADRNRLYESEIDHKALTKMRLLPDRKGYSYVTVPNPLHSSDGTEGICQE